MQVTNLPFYLICIFAQFNRADDQRLGRISISRLVHK